MEALYNDSVKAYGEEIDAFKEQIVDILSAQTEMEKDIKDVKNGTAQQHNNILGLLRYNNSVMAHKIGAMEDNAHQASKQDNKLLSDRLSQLSGQLEHLNTEVHQPVNLYKHCKEDTKHCTIAPEQSRQYWRDCATMYLPLKVDVSPILVHTDNLPNLVFRSLHPHATNLLIVHDVCVQAGGKVWV